MPDFKVGDHVLRNEGERHGRWRKRADAIVTGVHIDDGDTWLSFDNEGDDLGWDSEFFTLFPNESKPYAIQRKDFDANKHERMSAASNETISRQGRFVADYPDGWLVVRDKPQPVPLAQRIRTLHFSGCDLPEIAAKLIEECYATEFPSRG